MWTIKDPSSKQIYTYLKPHSPQKDMDFNASEWNSWIVMSVRGSWKSNRWWGIPSLSSIVAYRLCNIMYRRQTFAVATFTPLYICIASALMISPSYFLANWIDSFVFPTPSYQLETHHKPVVPTIITAFLRIACSIPVEINLTDLEFMEKVNSPNILNSKKRSNIILILNLINYGS